MQRIAPRWPGLGIGGRRTTALLLAVCLCGTAAAQDDLRARLGAPADPPPVAPPVIAPALGPGEGPKAKTEETPRAGAAEASAGISLDEAIRLTLSADPKIRAGFEAVNQANADLRTSALIPNPTLITDGIFLPLRRITPDRPGGPPQMDVQLAYPIDWFVFGKRVAAITSAGRLVRQSQSDYAELIRQRVTATTLAYYDVLETRALVELARADVENLTRLEAAIKKVVPIGRTMVELNRVRLDLLKSQTALRDATSAHTIAKAKLRALFGRADFDPAFDVSGSLNDPAKLGPLPLAEAYALAQENRPDIQSLRWQVEKARADVTVENRKAYPVVTPQFGWEHQFQQPIGSPDADTWTVTLTTTLPIFDRNQGNRWKAASILAQTNLNLQTALVDLRAEIEQVSQEMRTALETTQAVETDQLKAAKQVLDAITKGYTEAKGLSLLDVLDAQRNYRDTYRLYINSRANYWRALYRFSSAIGTKVGPHDEAPR